MKKWVGKGISKMKDTDLYGWRLRGRSH